MARGTASPLLGRLAGCCCCCLLLLLQAGCKCIWLWWWKPLLCEWLRPEWKVAAISGLIKPRSHPPHTQNNTPLQTYIHTYTDTYIGIYTQDTMWQPQAPGKADLLPEINTLCELSVLGSFVIKRQESAEHCLGVISSGHCVIGRLSLTPKTTILKGSYEVCNMIYTKSMEWCYPKF